MVMFRYYLIGGDTAALSGLYVTLCYAFVRLFILGDGRPLAVFRRAFRLLPALRPRPGPVHYSILTLGLVQCTIYL